MPWFKRRPKKESAMEVSPKMSDPEVERIHRDTKTLTDMRAEIEKARALRHQEPVLPNGDNARHE